MVFKIEKKLPLRRVVAKVRAQEINEMLELRHPGLEKGKPNYPRLFQKAVSDYMKTMLPEERAAMEDTWQQWQETGPPEDVQLKLESCLLFPGTSHSTFSLFRAAKKYSRRGILNAHQLLNKEMNVSCIIFSFFQDPDSGVLRVVW